MERGADEIEGLAGVVDDHLHDVEAEDEIGIIQQPQPGECAASDECLLFAIHGGGGRTVFAGASRFYFHKNEFISIAAHDIDFAAARGAEIPVEHLETASPKKFRRPLFAATAELVAEIFLPISQAGEARRAPAENCGDGFRKAHVFSEVRDGAPCRILCAGQMRIGETSRHVRSSTDRESP